MWLRGVAVIAVAARFVTTCSRRVRTTYMRSWKKKKGERKRARKRDERGRGEKEGVYVCKRGKDCEPDICG